MVGDYVVAPRHRVGNRPSIVCRQASNRAIRKYRIGEDLNVGCGRQSTSKIYYDMDPVGTGVNVSTCVVGIQVESSFWYLEILKEITSIKRAADQKILGNAK